MKRWGPPLAWAGLIFVASSIPGPAVLSPGVPHLDKAIHAAVYGVLAYLVARARGAQNPGALALAAVLAALYGVLDEIHQRWTPGRDADGWDVAADAVGAAAGVVLRGAAGRGYSEQTRAKP